MRVIARAPRSGNTVELPEVDQYIVLKLFLKLYTLSVSPQAGKKRLLTTLMGVSGIHFLLVHADDETSEKKLETCYGSGL